MKTEVMAKEKNQFAVVLMLLVQSHDLTWETLRKASKLICAIPSSYWVAQELDKELVEFESLLDQAVKVKVDVEREKAEFFQMLKGDSDAEKS